MSRWGVHDYGKDLFGFDEFTKAFRKMEQKYPDEATRMLNAAGKVMVQKTKDLTPVASKGRSYKTGASRRPGDLKKSWRLGKERRYRTDGGGELRFVRVMSYDTIAHLIESGHDVVHGGSKYTTEEYTDYKGRKRKRRVERGRISKAAHGVKGTGKAEGARMLEKAFKSGEKLFEAMSEQLLDKLTKDVQL